MARAALSCLQGVAAALALIAPVSAVAQSAAEPVPGDKDSLRATVGATYSEGRYGQTARTRVATVPVSLKYTHARFSIKVTVPYVHITGPGTLLDGTSNGASGGGSSGSSEVSETEIETEAGGGGTGTGAGEGDGTGTGSGTGVPAAPIPLRNRGGLGDATVTLAYALPLGETLSLESRGRFKLPTASSRKGLGTGKLDVTLAGDLVGTFGRSNIYAGVRRRFLGSSARFPVRDGWGFGAGASHELRPGLMVGADYDWLQSATLGRGPINEGSLWISARLNRTLRLQAYGGTGFSSRSADALGGLSLIWRP